MGRTGRHETFVQDAGLVGRGWLLGRPEFFWENASETRGGGCPCRPRAPQRMELGLGFGFGLGLG